jgi:LacI family transcriptional regulator
MLTQVNEDFCRFCVVLFALLSSGKVHQGEVLMTTLTGGSAGRRPPTMRDVAALAGVSFKTVSRVVNGEPGVSPELAGRVRDAVAMLGYRHDLAARSLRRADRRTAAIGLLLEDVANPFSSMLHRAIEDVARERGLMVFAGSSDEDPEREGHLLDALVSRRVDGLIAVPVGDGSGLRAAQRTGKPVVFVDRPGPPGCDRVLTDNEAATGRAVAHLLAHGHRRVAFLGDLPTIYTAAARHAGYLAALGAAGLPADPDLVRQGVRGIGEAEAATVALLSGPLPPTALFTGQNLITLGAIRGLQRLGAQHRVALVGFDDIDLADLLDPGVSVVAQDPATMGRLAATALLERLDGHAAGPRALVVPARLLTRGSGEIAPGAG